MENTDTLDQRNVDVAAAWAQLQASADLGQPLQADAYRLAFADPEFLLRRETRGIRFYVNGALAAQQDQQSVLYAGLDQFGPHSRTIGPMQVQSDYNFTRGGDIDEVRIYDRMLSDANVASLARGNATREIPALTRNLAEQKWQNEWWLRDGWNRLERR